MYIVTWKGNWFQLGGYQNNYMSSATWPQTSSSICVSLRYELTDDDATEEDKDYESELKTYLGARSLRRNEADLKRWYVLALYCLASFSQVVVWNTWSPIASSALYAFPSWQESTVALLNNWGCITFLTFIGPCCWLLNTKGLRVAFLLAGSLCMLGSGIRIIPCREEAFTVIIHAGAILNSIGGVTLSPAIVLLSSTWFPPDQRTSATGVGISMSLLGIAGSYVIGPTLVLEPPSESDSTPPEVARRIIREQIEILLQISFVWQVCLFILIAFTLPSQPLKPASRSTMLRSTVPVEGFFASVKGALSNGNFWCLSLASGLCSGITGPWLSLLTLIFGQTGVTQTETAQLGFWTIVCSSCLGLSVSRVSDFCRGHIKTILLTMITFADFMFFWILMFTTGTIPFTETSLMIVVMCGLSSVWCTPALFYELGAELTYPVTEGIAAGCMMAINNLCACLVYVQLYVFPNLNVMWMNYALFLFGFCSIILLTRVKVEYRRLMIDSH